VDFQERRGRLGRKITSVAKWANRCELEEPRLDSRLLGDIAGSRVVMFGTYYLASAMIATSALDWAGLLAR